MKRLRFIFATVFYMVAVSVLGYAKADKSPQEAYIEKYAGLAVQEMYRSGVPASITLAQGLLESGSGCSELALKSNNHFGIKCHNTWKGDKVYHDDDRKGECFRKYDSPDESFRDHSDFLRYRDRYKFLFDYRITDYKAWAYGLKKAGYATDPSYPQKLIKLIEEYELHEYDSKPVSYGQAGKKSKKEKRQKQKGDGKSQMEEIMGEIPPSPSMAEEVLPLSGKQREEFEMVLSRQMYSKNGVPFIYSVEGETYGSIAASNNLFLKELLRYNDLKNPQPLQPGTVVYLQAKKKQAAKGLDKHVMDERESLRDISQRFGIRLARIYRLNDFEEGHVPQEGDIIKLRR